MRAHLVAHDGVNGNCGGKFLRAWAWIAFYAVLRQLTLQILQKVGSHESFYALVASPLELMVIRVAVSPVSRNGLLARSWRGGGTDLSACGHARLGCAHF
jgi:hypothetical protein